MSGGLDPKRTTTGAPEEAAEAVREEPVPEVCHTQRASHELQNR